MNKINKTTDLILHGHFYQPPRENPRTGIIGKQLSASPYPDWNERIYSDCYNANVHSRYLSGVRRILSMTNNYEYISFNFGPTLLSWLKRKHPDTYSLIIEADKKSVVRLGHGNAMAQSFNHTILPLCTEAEARAQIVWGLEDFSLRFGREAEGMWLPETGINGMVIDLLAEYGLKFVILSPWQCKSVENEEGKMVDLNGKSAPYGKPFILTGDTGATISAFFYHPSLAEGISFGHLLRDADNLYARLLTIKREEGQPLIQTATDGEIYGHHEPYGDMALAALIKKVHERSDFRLTNYATFLEAHPATLHATLHEGEEAKGTSWSCVHGVSRWYKDCGCHTGGDESWNQTWRTPLRQAFDNLGKKIDACIHK
ncbi:MAG TPA: glycoside hydrolase, partial [Sphaerochaeta sp.]|nr:glycoside hydrolase [Sphaerochaeta sp.]